MPRHYILRPVKKLLGDWANWAKLLGDAYPAKKLSDANNPRESLQSGPVGGSGGGRSVDTTDPMSINFFGRNRHLCKVDIDRVARTW